MSREFRKVFTEKLESGGYDVVQEDGDDVLLIRPAIINLKVVIPKDAGTGDSALIIRSAGEMTLFLEVFDSVSGELLAKGMDRKVEMDKETVSGDFMYFWAASEAAKNTALINHAFASWADSLVEALNVARSH